MSRDTLASHAKFQGKYELPFELASDPDEKLCRQFDVIKEKNMYGRKHWGIQRATFLIGRDGTVLRVWPKVKPAGHAEEVLDMIRTLTA